MLASFMILVNLLGFTCCATNLKFSKNFMIQSMVERQFDKKILAMQNDSGGEYHSAGGLVRLEEDHDYRPQRITYKI
jgi:hypothetical protein